MPRFLKTHLICVALLLSPLCSSFAAEQSFILQSTTSTANSGLYEHLLPLFKATSDINVKVVAVGTGQAIRNARNCDATVLLVHARNAEEEFVASGFGVERFDLMYNDFIIAGPKDDPANISASDNVIDALKRIASSKSLFVSRADDSGTHKKEMFLWRQAKIDAQSASGRWYRETGSGMGATLNASVGMNAYVMTDRATWISFKNKQDFRLLYEGDEALFNQYGVILVDKNKCPNINALAGQQFVNWLISEDGQHAIGQYKLNDQQLFFPNAKRLE